MRNYICPRPENRPVTVTRLVANFRNGHANTHYATTHAVRLARASDYCSVERFGVPTTNDHVRGLIPRESAVTRENLHNLKQVSLGPSRFRTQCTLRHRVRRTFRVKRARRRSKVRIETSYNTKQITRLSS